MAYGDLKVNNLIYDTGSGDATRSVVSIPLTASPTFTGTVTVPTPTAGDNSTKAATTAFVVASFATKASPTFTGTPTLPTGTVAVTQSAGNSTTAIATTAFVATSFAPLASPTLTGTPAAPTASANTNTTQIATTAFVMTELGDYAPKAAPAFTGNATGVNLTLSGNLTVNGTTTTIDTTTLDVEDKNITLGKVSTPTDTTADGGGITLKGATDKTITWTNATDSWDFNQKIDVDAGSNTTQAIFSGSGGSGSRGLAISTEAAGAADEGVILNARASGTTATMKFQTNSATALTLAGNGGNATFAGTVSDSKGNLRSIPKNNQTSAYTAVASDAGKVIFISSGGVTINTGVFSEGDALTIINNSGSDQTITKGSGMTLHNSADATNANRTLAARGMATIWFNADSNAYISGSGLS